MHFPAQVEQIPLIRSWMHRELEPLHLDNSVLMKIELASEEVLVNIIHHAYKGKGGGVDLSIRTVDHRIEIVIRDQGPFFDPLAAETKFDPTLPLEERQVGGLGIPFMKQFMDEVRYERQGDENVLTLIKKISPVPSRKG